ncbi:TSUP family transporter [Streptomyces sp. YGL11-2]|uniref:TSUP family transporter n=1 Tax=Streptomyces sp. YGL11-2 TaxID=3414028 RepID=UPI003CEF003D
MTVPGATAHLGVLPLAALVLAALLVGVSKTAVSGVGALSVALFAAVVPARESTGALLPLLLVGDVLAVRAYRRHTDWSALLRLLPSVMVGILLGVGFVAWTDDAVMRRTIGTLLLTIVLHHLWRRGRRRRAGPASGGGRVAQARAADREPGAEEPGAGAGAGPAPAVRTARAARTLRAALTVRTVRQRQVRAARPRQVRALLFGLIAGFATMVANAGGPAMSLYLLSAGFGVLGFLGTGAWFFLIVNLVKLPFSIGLGLVTPGALALDGLLAPAVVAGALLGRALVRRVDQAVFERLVLVFTALASLGLLR